MREVLQTVPLDVLGQRVRLHRASMSLSIRDLASRAMVSKTSIVSLEQGKSCRPATLVKVCSAMGLHVERLLVPSEVAASSPPQVHRHVDDRWYDLDGLTSGPIEGVDRPLTAEERAKWHESGIVAQMLMFKNIPLGAGSLAGIIELSGRTETRSHPGSEFVFVVSGKARIEIGGDSFLLETGESAYIADGKEHSYGPDPASGESVSLLAVRVN